MGFFCGVDVDVGGRRVEREGRVLLLRTKILLAWIRTDGVSSYLARQIDRQTDRSARWYSIGTYKALWVVLLTNPYYGSRLLKRRLVPLMSSVGEQ